MQTYVTLQPLLHSHSTSHRTASFISTLCNTSSFTFILCPEVTKDSQFLQNVAECKNLSRGPENGKLWGGSLVAWVERWVNGWVDGWMGGWLIGWDNTFALSLSQPVTSTHCGSQVASKPVQMSRSCFVCKPAFVTGRVVDKTKKLYKYLGLKSPLVCWLVSTCLFVQCWHFNYWSSAKQVWLSRESDSQICCCCWTQPCWSAL